LIAFLASVAGRAKQEFSVVGKPGKLLWSRVLGGDTVEGRYSLEKDQQLSNRHAPPFIRHALSSFWQNSLSRFYALSTACLQARARKKEDLWIPGTADADHAAIGPEAVTALFKKRLSCSPPCPDSFAASEALRLHSFKLDRAQPPDVLGGLMFGASAPRSKLVPRAVFPSAHNA
jgi:hypothetical protein